MSTLVPAQSTGIKPVDYGAMFSGSNVSKNLASVVVVPHLTVTISSHNFCVTKVSPRGREACNTFGRKFIAWGWQNTGGRYSKVPLKVYASATKDRSSFRFHINALEDFKKLLEDMHITGNLVVWQTAPEAEVVKCEFEIHDKWQARDYQIPVIEYMSELDRFSKLVEMPTGTGKGFSSMMALKNLGMRTAIVVKPMYIQKWQDELVEVFKGISEYVLVVKGGAHLKALLDLAEADQIDSKIIIISSTTFRNWVSEYETYGEDIVSMGYACTPGNFFSHIKAGVRLIDECHQDYHFCFKLDTYTHTRTSISLSATLVNQDPFVTAMYDVMFPVKDRIEKLALDKYIEAFAVHFMFKAPDHIRTEEYGSKTYSHMAVEKSILKHVPTSLNYYRLIEYILEIGYFKDKKPGEKAIVFAASIDMCTKLTAYFAKKYPDLDVRRYVEDDSFANVIDADIRFTTIGSGGTAIDIPNLSCGIMTTGIQSIQANIQALGRLRKRPDQKTQFYYFVADNIDKQVQYHVAKRELFKPRTKSFNEIMTGHTV